MKATFPSSLVSLSTVTSLTRGSCGDQDQWDRLLLRGRNTYPSDEELDPLADMEIRGIRNPTSILSRQGNDVVVEYIERKTLSEVPFEVGLEEIISRLIKIPSVIKLNAPQLGKLVRLFFRAENIVGGGCREDDSRANHASDELVVLSGDGVQDCRAEERHGAMRRGGEEGLIFRF